MSTSRGYSGVRLACSPRLSGFLSGFRLAIYLPFQFWLEWSVAAAAAAAQPSAVFPCAPCVPPVFPCRSVSPLSHAVNTPPPQPSAPARTSQIWCDPPTLSVPSFVFGPSDWPRLGVQHATRSAYALHAHAMHVHMGFLLEPGLRATCMSIQNLSGVPFLRVSVGWNTPP